jgi:hypothetical protein
MRAPRDLSLSLLPADTLAVPILLLRRETLADPERYVPTWLFPEELILGSLAGLDDETLQSVHLGRFFVTLADRVSHDLEPRR